MATQIPEGVQRIADLNNCSAQELWDGLKSTLCNERLVIAFNHAINDGINNAKMLGLNDQEAAHHAINYAGETILGHNRPASEVDTIVRSAGPLMREIIVPPVKPKTATNFPLFGVIFSRH